MAMIWLVEDDLNLSALTNKVLVKKGYDVEVFYEAPPVIKAAKKTRPDLILMDITLPGMDGADAVRELRKNPKLKDIPVIFLTGLVTNKEEDQEGIGILIDGQNYETLGKPFEIAQLLRMIEKTIN